MFAAVYFEEPFVRSKLPTCEDFFNVFHPSDLVANRVEGLIKRYVYPDNANQRKDSFFEIARAASNETGAEIEYQFGDQVLGPVTVPWYQNHGLCRS